MSSDKLKIMIADDHQIVITGLRLLLANAGINADVDGLLSTEELVKSIKGTDYDLVILDINMPGSDTHSIIHLMKSFRPDIKILIFSMNPEEMYARRYLKEGVTGYLMKDANEKDIVEAIRKVLDGRIYISAKLKEILSDNIITGKKENPFEALSPREFEVFKLLIKGVGVKEIAGLTNLHPSTISTHKANIHEKTQTRNVLQLKEVADNYGISGYPS